MLQNPGLKKTSPKELVTAIRTAKMLASANTFADSDTLSSPELLSALIELLDWEQPRRNDSFDPSYGLPTYPAIDAIGVMRKPALPSLVQVLENEDPASLKAKNALQTIWLILHRHDVDTINFLRTEALTSKSSKSKERLLAAANAVSERHLASPQN